MTRLLSLMPWILTSWTVFLWLSRLRNVLGDDDLTSTGRAWRIGVVVLFVLLAVVAAAGLIRRTMVPLMVLIVWTVCYWLVRGTGILLGDWSVGFKVVHTVLMVVSLGLAIGAWIASWSGPSESATR
jgi:hypothetical protein